MHVRVGWFAAQICFQQAAGGDYCKLVKISRKLPNSKNVYVKICFAGKLDCKFQKYPIGCFYKKIFFIISKRKEVRAGIYFC